MAPSRLQSVTMFFLTTTSTDPPPQKMASQQWLPVTYRPTTIGNLSTYNCNFMQHLVMVEIDELKD